MKRYVPKKYSDDLDIVYSREQIIAELVEEIVGQKVMKKSYFNADLDSLIQALTKYDTEENILKFLATYKVAKQGKLNKDINHFLLRIYLNRITDDYRNNLISLDDLVNKLANYFYRSAMSCLDDVCKDMLGKILTINVLERVEAIECAQRNVYIK